MRLLSPRLVKTGRAFTRRSPTRCPRTAPLFISAGAAPTGRRPRPAASRTSAPTRQNRSTRERTRRRWMTRLRTNAGFRPTGGGLSAVSGAIRSFVCGAVPCRRARARFGCMIPRLGLGRILSATRMKTAVPRGSETMRLHICAARGEADSTCAASICARARTRFWSQARRTAGSRPRSCLHPPTGVRSSFGAVSIYGGIAGASVRASCSIRTKPGKDVLRCVVAGTRTATVARLCRWREGMT